MSNSMEEENSPTTGEEIASMSPSEADSAASNLNEPSTAESSPTTENKEIAGKQKSMESLNMSRVLKLLEQQKNNESNVIYLLNFVLQTTDQSKLDKFVALNGLSLLGDIIKDVKNISKSELLVQILKVLSHVPVTLKSLKSSSIGKLVNKLKSHKDNNVQSLSNTLIQSWMSLLSNAAEEQLSKDASSPSILPKKSAGSVKGSLGTTVKKEPTKQSAIASQKKRKTDEGDSSESPTKKATGSLSPTISGPATGSLVKKQVIASSDFENELFSVSNQATAASKSRTSLIEKPPAKKHKMQLLEQKLDTDITLIKKSAPTLASKPLSADDIRKEKFKQKVLEEIAPSSASVISSSGNVIEPPLKKPKYNLPPNTSTVPVSLINPTLKKETSLELKDSQELMKDRTAMDINSKDQTSNINNNATDAKESPLTPNLQMQMSTSTQPTSQALLPKGESQHRSKVVSAWDIEEIPEDLEEISPEVTVGISRKTGKPKKRVSWPSDEKLKSVREFVKEENIGEEAGSHVHSTFASAVHEEHKNEKERLKQLLAEKKKQEEATTTIAPSIPWNTPPDIWIPEDCAVHWGSESKQKEIEAERETKELSAVYVTDSQIPESPYEPASVRDEPPYDDEKTTIIPWDDTTPSTSASVMQQPMTMMDQSGLGAGTVPNLVPNLGMPLGTLNPLALGLLTPDVVNTLLANPELLQAFSSLSIPSNQLSLPSLSSLPSNLIPNNTSNNVSTNSNANLNFNNTLNSISPNLLASFGLTSLPNLNQASVPVPSSSMISNPIGNQPSFVPPTHQPKGHNQTFAPNLNTSSSGRRKSSKVCTFYGTRQGCRNGENCPFIHEQTSANTNPSYSHSSQDFRDSNFNYS